MTLADMHTCTRPYLTAKEVAGVLGCDPHSIRRQAHIDPRALGYEVIVIGRRVRIPRMPFLAYMEGEMRHE